MNWKAWRHRWFTQPLFRAARAAVPRLSDTERQAIEAGDVWWDAQFFSGRPRWRQMQALAPASLSPEDQAFLEGPVARLCCMLNDWEISWRDADLPPAVWDFIRHEGFFGMIIPREYGGLGFSPYAHSEVVRRLSVRSTACGATRRSQASVSSTSRNRVTRVGCVDPIRTIPPRPGPPASGR